MAAKSKYEQAKELMLEDLREEESRLRARLEQIRAQMATLIELEEMAKRNEEPPATARATATDTGAA